jgi:hypothetical protein
MISPRSGSKLSKIFWTTKKKSHAFFDPLPHPQKKYNKYFCLGQKNIIGEQKMAIFGCGSQQQENHFV